MSNKLYKKISLIGSGTYGKVWTTSTQRSDKVYALKEIVITSENQLQVSTEIKLLSKCKHMNIIGYKESFVSSDGILCIVMEYADKGDLQSYITKRGNEYIEEDVVLNWFVQIANALQYIHSLNILHRDMKCQNIFLNSKNLIKVGDFGISKLLQHYNDQAHTAIGTPFYLSPEICQKQAYNQKSDIWALGCVLYQLLTLKQAFEGKNIDFLIMRIMKADYKPLPKKYSNISRRLVSQLLQINQKQRPHAQEILKMRDMSYYVNIYILQMKDINREIYLKGLKNVFKYDNDDYYNLPNENALNKMNKITNKVSQSEMISRKKDKKLDVKRLSQYKECHVNFPKNHSLFMKKRLTTSFMSVNDSKLNNKPKEAFNGQNCNVSKIVEANIDSILNDDNSSDSKGYKSESDELNVNHFDDPTNCKISNNAKIHISAVSDPTDSIKSKIKNETPLQKWKSYNAINVNSKKTKENVTAADGESENDNLNSLNMNNVYQNLFENCVLYPEDAYEKYSNLTDILNNLIGGRRLLSLKRRLSDNLRDVRKVEHFIKILKKEEIKYIPLLYHLHHLEIMCLR